MSNFDVGNEFQCTPKYRVFSLTLCKVLLSICLKAKFTVTKVQNSQMYLYTYLNSRRLEKRKNRLSFKMVLKWLLLKFFLYTVHLIQLTTNDIIFQEFSVRLRFFRYALLLLVLPLLFCYSFIL